jgi:hypothetical protein
MRRYSCSTRWPRRGAGGAPGWMRLRAWIEGLASAQMTNSPGSSSFAVPAALVEVEHRPGLLEEVGVPGEDPRPLLPRLDRVLGQPAGDRRRRRLTERVLDDEAVQLRAREARQRGAVGLGQLARDRLDLGDLLRGEKRRGRPDRARSSRPALEQLRADQLDGVMLCCARASIPDLASILINVGSAG